LNWRAVRLIAAMQPSVLSLASALKKAEPRRPNRWVYLGVLVALIVLRSAFYWQVGPSVQWIPTIHLGAIALHFRSDFFGRALLFSVFSFVVTLAVFYLWLILLSLVNRTVPNSDPLQRIIRLQLGGLEQWPVVGRLALVPLLVGTLWALLHQPFARLGLIAPSSSAAELCQQAGIVGLGSFLAWKYLIVAILFAHIVNSYVYLGNSPAWNFVTVTARNLLRPLRWLPLGIGKADFAPLVGIALVWALAWLYARQLTTLFQTPPPRGPGAFNTWCNASTS